MSSLGGPAQAQAQGSTSVAARLPAELLEMVLHHVLDDSKTVDEDGFRIPPKPAGERVLYSVSLVCRSFYLASRSLLFRYLHLGNESRGRALLKALNRTVVLKNSETGKEQQIEGYLRPLVHGLKLDILNRNTKGAIEGISPATLSQLADVLVNVSFLDLSLSYGGTTFSNDMITSLGKFKNVKDVEAEGQGSVTLISFLTRFARNIPLESLNIRTMVSFLPGLSANFPLDPPPSFATSLHSLTLWECTLVPGDLEAILGALLPKPPEAPKLRHLTLVRLATGGQTTVPAEYEMPYEIPAALLLPFVPRLHSLHLILFDRASITHNGLRNSLVASGQLKRGRLQNPLPRPTTRLANDIAPAFSSDLVDLTLGGPFCFTPELFDLLPDDSIKVLKLINCARDLEGVEDSGVSVDQFLLALGGKWSAALREVRLVGMTRVNPRDSNEGWWDWEAMERIEEQLRKTGDGKARLVHDGPRLTEAMKEMLRREKARLMEPEKSGKRKKENKSEMEKKRKKEKR
ncbi:hypothetical protein MNV49_000377 [Pseudohyphozyma bogoriensis]|nr:hypothetical protein MNV49_000377 [Pseudohyphozyma bogoriensis]